VEEFAREVKTYHKNFQSRMPSVKVAIIDDGINASQFDNHTCIAGGTSFQCHHNRPDRPLDYWASTGAHGTEMAKMVQRICPVAELYIIRLGEGTGEKGTRQIKVETAIKAIEWATNAGVNIISMSWSISQTKEASSDTYMPAVFGDPVKIGAATPEGGKWSFTGSQKVDFYLPGVDIPVTDKAGVVRFEQGSSFATAIAAGLAALLQYCISVAVRDGSETPVFRTDDMKHAFHTLCSTHREIPEVGEFFKDVGRLDTPFKMLERYEHIAASLRL
ncbi:subtilisin-like protein, partial [Aspergillus steynii IBT 23096]